MQAYKEVIKNQGELHFICSPCENRHWPEEDADGYRPDNLDIEAPPPPPPHQPPAADGDQSIDQDWPLPPSPVLDDVPPPQDLDDQDWPPPPQDHEEMGNGSLRPDDMDMPQQADDEEMPPDDILDVTFDIPHRMVEEAAPEPLEE